jgi:hypothetical protein
MALLPDSDSSGFVIMVAGESAPLKEEKDSSYIDNLSPPFLHMFEQLHSRVYSGKHYQNLGFSD